MKRIITAVFCSIIFLTGLFIFAGFFDPLINDWVLSKIGRFPGPKSVFLLKLTGAGLVLFSGILFLLLRNFIAVKNFFDVKVKRKFGNFDAAIEAKLSRYINFSTEKKFVRWNAINKWDTVFLIFALILSIFMMIERLQGNHPDVVLGSDAANISSMAAALNQPDLFEEDFFLHDQDNYKLYLQLHVFLIKELGKLFGNYTLPFVIILGPTVFLTLIGNYWLGRIILNSRLFAFLFVLISITPVYLLFENWGLAEDAVPRTLMQALLPFLLGLVWMWRDKPGRWPIIAVFTGLLTYIHAVGSPTVMAMIVLGLFSLMPSQWATKKKLLFCIFLSMTMLLVASVFIYNYLQAKQPTEMVEYESIVYLYRTYFPPNILDVKTSAQLLFGFFVKSWILPLGVMGIVFLWILNSDHRRLSKLSLSWLSAIFIVSILIPYFERVIESYLRILPIETELIRGTRFFVPILTLTAFTGLGMMPKVIRMRKINLIAVFIGLIFIGQYFSFRNTDLLFFEKSIDCFRKGKIVCSEKSDLQRLLSEIDKQTPEKTAIFFAGDAYDTLPLSIRYIANRSLVYSWKDRGMGFSHPLKMVQWHALFEVINQHPSTNEWYSKNPQEFIEFISNLGADYFVMKKADGVPLISHNFRLLIYENASYQLVKIEND